MKKEIWKTVQGYEFYQVSSWGRMKSLDRWVKCGSKGVRFLKGKILKPRADKDGYLRIWLSDSDGKRKSFGVHRLVAKAYNPDWYNECYIDHINGIPASNEAWNLDVIDNKNKENTLRRYRLNGKPRGAQLRDDGGTWRARISLDSKLLSLGYFSSEAEAQARFYFSYIEHHNIEPWNISLFEHNSFIISRLSVF